MNESSLELEACERLLLRPIRRPGPVRKLVAVQCSRGLVLRWVRPVGSRVEGYRIDRTREGRDYEPVAEITGTQLLVRRPPWREPWFYRVRAWNARGEGGYYGVYLYQRRGWSRRTRTGSIIQYVAAIPGLRVTVSELAPE